MDFGWSFLLVLGPALIFAPFGKSKPSKKKVVHCLQYRHRFLYFHRNSCRKPQVSCLSAHVSHILSHPRTNQARLLPTHSQNCLLPLSHVPSSCPLPSLLSSPSLPPSISPPSSTSSSSPSCKAPIAPRTKGRLGTALFGFASLGTSIVFNCPPNIGPDTERQRRCLMRRELAVLPSASRIGDFNSKSEEWASRLCGGLVEFVDESTAFVFTDSR